MHSCMRILFICTVQFLWYMRVYHRCFQAPACMSRRELRSGSFSVCPCLPLVAGTGGCVLAGVEIRGFPCIFLYFCWCCGGGWVCACVRTRTHGHYLGHSIIAHVWDGHLQSRKDRDRLKFCIHDM